MAPSFPTPPAAHAAIPHPFRFRRPRAPHSHKSSHIQPYAQLSYPAAPILRAIGFHPDGEVGPAMAFELSEQ